MLALVHRMFGTVFTSPVQKGENAGWFTDQRMISILIDDIKNNNNLTVSYRARKTNIDRIDRSRWSRKSAGNIQGKIDAHLLEDAYRPDKWFQIVPLVQGLFPSQNITWTNQYYDGFMRVTNMTK